MKLSPKQQKWAKRIAILLLLRFIIGGALYYIVVYRFKDVLQYVVKKESGNAYAFNASDIEVSLWHKNIVINNADLSCKDTINTTPHYSVQIPQVYLGIGSWTDLIFHKRVSVDSLAIVLPSLTAHEHNKQPKKQVSFHVSQVSDMLHKVMTHLQVRSFSLQNGSFAYGHRENPIPFISNHINFTIHNFSRNNADNKKLLAADDIDLRMQDQNWHLPGGQQEVAFKNLHFSGDNQRFELDSFTYRTLDTSRQTITFSADKLAFNSTQLADLYEKEQLFIDTLLLYRPVITLQTAAKPTEADSTKAISQSFRKLFKNMTFRYIDIKEGSVLLQKSNSTLPLYITQKTDLKIYRLQIVPDSAHVTTDSIQLKLHNLSFITRDSLFQMKIDEFTFHNNEVLFTNAIFSPTAFHHNPDGITFKAPSLRIKDISLEDLLNKRLRGTVVDLYRPSIVLYNKDKTPGKTSKKDNHFFQSLHGLRELIVVDSFHIIQGELHASASIPVRQTTILKDINATVLLNQFLSSDSLIDIKRSLPNFQVALIAITSPTMQLTINNYRLNGANRHNGAESFHLSLPDNTSFSGKNIYWEIFDWDIYQHYKAIQIEDLHIQELQATINKSEQATVRKQPKDLPVIRITRIDVGRLHFNQQTPKAQLQLDGRDLCLYNLNTEKRTVNWENIDGAFSNIRYTGNGMTAVVQQAIINNQYQHTLQNISLGITKEDGHTQLQLPLVKIQSDLRSTDFSALHIRSLTADAPQINLLSSASAKKTGGIVSMPLNAIIDNLLISNASVKEVTVKAADTTSFSARVDINIKELKTYTNQPTLCSYAHASVTASAATFNGRELTLSVPKLTAMFSKGTIQHNTGIWAIHTGADINWSDVQLHTNKPDNTSIALEHLTGSFRQPAMVWQQGKPLEWTSLLNAVAIREGAMRYAGKNITATVQSFQWEPLQRHVTLHTFSVLPKLSQEDVFKKSGWQTDYMLVKGEQLDIRGLRFNRQPGDSSIAVRTVTANGVSLYTTRDKRMPFQHGIEKPMPTHLIQSISYPLHVDTILLQQCTVMVKEVSLQTEKEGTIPLEQLDAVITHFTNRPQPGDSLVIAANARVLNNRIDYFLYKEAYLDSLSGFRAYVYTSPMKLAEFSQATTPLAAISVRSGLSDTLFTTWTGNKHAAFGTMDFYYRDLAVQIFDKKNTSKKSFLLSLENMLANKLILRKSNNKQSVVFFERDKEKFVFNYWVKTTLSGFMSSVGLKRSKKYNKKYREVQDVYSLPVID